MAVGGIGTDTSGSVRTPSALNGLVGLRPSLHRIPVTGTTPVSPFFDTIGPMARSAVDVLRLYTTMAGPISTGFAKLEGTDMSAVMRGVEGLRIGVPSVFFFEQCDPQVTVRVTEALQVLQAQGASIVEVGLPDAAPGHAHLSTMMLADAYEFHRARLTTEPGTYGADVRRRILAGSVVSGVDYSEARKWADHWSAEIRSTLREVDVLVSPTVPVPAPRLADFDNSLEATANLTRLTYAWTLMAGPIISIPCGFVYGLPVGMQVVGDEDREDLLLRVAISYQHDTSWHRVWPEIVTQSVAAVDDPSKGPVR
jgi:aspartyl-tRNA(Asn)/glutamyl-tRNA(Gln) amidotransferase subunit A